MGSFASRWLILFLISVFVIFVFVPPSQGIQISGTISSTLTIVEDSELVGDVNCTAVAGPCIAFGASGIKLRLNGFTITGSSTDCKSATASKDGIDVSGGLHNVAILGPGVVQRFAVFGIALLNVTKVRIEGVTATDNCFSGIFLLNTTDSDIEKNIAVRNSLGSKNNPCGGT
jgi:parallel beta-helix repeat protein